MNFSLKTAFFVGFFPKLCFNTVQLIKTQSIHKGQNGDRVPLKMDTKWAKKRSQSVCDVSLIATQKDDHDNINIIQKLASRLKNSANAQKRDTLMSVRTRSTTNLGENELIGADNSNSRRRSCFREELSQFRNWMSRRLSLQPSPGRKSSRGQEQEVLVDAEEHDQHENSFSDEDSHIMEIPDFLIVDRSFLKPVVQEQRRRFSLFS